LKSAFCGSQLAHFSTSLVINPDTISGFGVGRMMARALLLAAFVATSAGYVMNAPSPTSTRSAVQMFGGKKKITVNKPKPVKPTGKPMGPFSTQDFLSGVKPAKMTKSWPIASPFAKKQVVTTAKPQKKVVSSGNPIEGFEGLIASAFVIVLIAKATLFAPAPEPTGPPVIVIAMIMAAFGFGALMMLPDPVKPVESWYDAGHRLDGSFVKPVDPAAAKAEAILKEGMQVGAKAKI
jgi:hypothetical protein